MSLYKTQIKRELWENKVSFVYTPAIVSLLIVLLVACAAFYSGGKIDNNGVGFHYSSSNSSDDFGIHVPNQDTAVIKSSDNQGADDLKKEHQQHVSMAAIMKDTSVFNGMVTGIMYSNCAMLYLVFAVVLAAYALRCLFDDRKNKDILFWRSMPVSETTNVLAKLIMIFLIAPVTMLALNYIVTVIVFICGVIYLGLHGVAMGGLVSSVIEGGAYYIPLQIFYELIFSLLMLLPVIGFALFSSAFAKKTPIFIFVSPLLLCLADKIMNSLFGINLGVVKLFLEYGQAIALTRDAFLLQHSFTFTQAMILPLFICVTIGALFIAGAIWLRNNRYEI
ncbi:hypothetical protein GCM10011613_22290 [Cellvibrio zantedeschiae]|uniref:ABC transporter permease n=1 Tax=Cellvibrio zantedeschiae TaxID=1237077 RepID=A0ABQ3B2X7_9GAMM|nr:hypothetical protein [Cellvibrio zantedeschiae]GGY77287.1 hypothetical protein GCM10011613_22290 [Cellvibrio zantedeschiae]